MSESTVHFTWKIYVLQENSNPNCPTAKLWKDSKLFWGDNFFVSFLERVSSILNLETEMLEIVDLYSFHKRNDFGLLLSRL